MPNRRQFMNQLGASALVLPMITQDSFLNSAFKKDSFSYEPLLPQQPTPLPVPEGMRIPLGLDYYTLAPTGDGLTLNVGKGKKNPKGTVYLRLQLALDTREKDEVEIFLGKSGRKIGQSSIWYATALQLFETKLDATYSEISQEGIHLKMLNGIKPMYILATSADNGSHLLVSKIESMPTNASSSVLYSQRSVQPFGWLEGCVLDGLQELYKRKNDKKALEAIRMHLRLFLKPDGGFIYEDPYGRISDNKFNNLEAGLPFAISAQHLPDHPSFGLFLKYCKTRIGDNNTVKSNSLTAEGCYTIAYPLATIARDLRQPEWFEYALIELEDRIETLTDSGAVYTRAWKDKGLKTYRNWGRGYTWFMLGLIRTAEILQNDSPFKNDSRIKHLKEVYVYYAQLALKNQQADHSWRAYLDLEETGYDCSATAGLGAMLAHGHRMGWLTGFSNTQLKQIQGRLSQSLTPDGFLKDICQQNAAGEELQKSEYRVIAQYVLGLKAHIDAHIS
ncbi:rhamnogalacturonyl hydrolase YesR [Dyadobacter jejuensis]|uniref:Rhamnogalacturonyl hydrolase YesR n=1 Tax=Dyadobacter jejuensis TaxID=1082580 RepID=A0A316AF71_9BACT|nr:glycoside hydrolase family 88 protein [Dyadobacter jejuensis]PWJ55544.1 rhamnogalacturonyl hydrolase YesR [Dyadobacter jejuensis]